jgi:histidinol-phosphate aminotransferase
MMDVTALARPEILAMQPYASARSSMSADGILLNANEAPRVLLDEPDFEHLALNRYPPPQPAALRNRLSALYGVAEEQMLITRGSDEGIDLLVRVFCRPGSDAIAECLPCFGMYRVAAAIQGAAIVAVPRREEGGFHTDVGALSEAVSADPRIRLVFLTSPNNPTGDCLEIRDLEHILSAAAGRALVVLDEAYIEFSERESAAALVARNPQLVVLRTLSKAWGAAGLRCGTVIADPAVIDLLRRVMAPYPLATPAVDAAMRVTDEHVRRRQRDMIAEVLELKASLLQNLQGKNWVRVLWPGEANFILARVDDAAGLTAWCETHDIRIRNFDGQPQLDGCVRFSIGTGEEMQAVIEVLGRYGGSK